MTERVQRGELAIAKELYDFIVNQAIEGTGISVDDYWTKFEAIVADLMPKNKALLAKRDAIQAQIDAWHQANPKFDFAAYKAFSIDVIPSPFLCSQYPQLLLPHLPIIQTYFEILPVKGRAGTWACINIQ